LLANKLRDFGLKSLGKLTRKAVQIGARGGGTRCKRDGVHHHAKRHANGAGCVNGDAECTSYSPFMPKGERAACSNRGEGANWTGVRKPGLLRKPGARKRDSKWQLRHTRYSHLAGCSHVANTRIKLRFCSTCTTPARHLCSTNAAPDQHLRGINVAVIEQSQTDAGSHTCSEDVHYKLSGRIALCLYTELDGKRFRFMIFACLLLSLVVNWVISVVGWVMQA